MGGTLAAMGMFAFCKAAGLADYSTPDRVGEVTVYSSAYLGGGGDLFAPFPTQHVHVIMLLGATAVLVGCALRIASYWKVLGQ